jgi:hypothetical protein
MRYHGVIDGVAFEGSEMYDNLYREDFHILDIQADHDVYVDFRRRYETDAHYACTEEDLGLYHPDDPVPAHTINPGDIEYLGAFKLPTGAELPGQERFVRQASITYYPKGDPGSTDDFPGSLFGIGHYKLSYVSEVSIPKPVISENINDLPKAEYLQHPTDISSQYEDHPFQLYYISSQNKIIWAQKVWFFGNTSLPRLGWTSPQLGSYGAQGEWVPEPDSAGYWFLGERILNVGVGFFEIPSEWAQAHLSNPDRTLAMVAARTTKDTMNGVNIYATAPWTQGDPPPDHTRLAYETLLEYGYVQQKEMQNYNRGTATAGAAWVQDGDRSAVIIVQAMSYGNIWYNGHGNGGAGQANARRWTIRFYNPADLADVLTGTKKPYEPQPYATLDITPYFFGNYYGEYTGQGMMHGDKYNGAAYDPVRNYIYISEASVDAGKRPVVHVFRVAGSASAAQATASQTVVLCSESF